MARQKKQKQLNQIIRDEIARITENNQINSQILEDFAFFVLENHRKKSPTVKTSLKSAKAKPLKLTELKKAVYQYFNVKNTTELKQLDFGQNKIC